MEVFVSRFAEAMAVQEGFYVVGSKARRNKNPGNIRPWKGCTLPVSGGMIRFPSTAAGWEQLHKQIRLNIKRGLTCLEFFAGQRDEEGKVIPGGYWGYAPASDGNDPLGYANFVAARIGIPIDVPLATVAELPRESAAQREGF